MKQIRERVSQALLVLLYWLLASAQVRNFQETGQVTGLVYIALLLLLVVMIIVRRGATTVTSSWVARGVAAIGTFGPFAFRPGGTPLLPDWFTAGLIGVGGVITILGVASLGRSIGVLAAHRGLVESGVFRIVRHPLYAGYLLSHVALLLGAPTRWNVICWLVVDSSQIARIFYEERLLATDEQYVRYQQRVRWRLVPGVF
jgi:protein-S-isoprenylcysteine O-methyltransferase Ste14